MMNKIYQLKDYMKKKGIDGVISYKPENRRYLSGFTGTSGYVLITNKGQYFITDFRYVQQASSQCKGFEIIKHTNNKTIFDIINDYEIKKLGFEEDYITYSAYNEFKEKLSNTELIPLKGIIEDLRMIKTHEELEAIKKAANIADKAFEHILTKIKPGISEKEISLELEFFMKKKGAKGNSFEFIVASGKRSSLPHGVASDKIIEDGDFVTLDFGCIYNGYCSDMTRTVVVGNASPKQREIYDIVLKAQEEALKHIKAGATGIQVDKIARDIIDNEGYGEYFGHGLGHGVGLEVHEAPRLSPKGKDILRPNMVVTNEPGIYIPDFGGVRIEDLVVVKEDGPDILSKSPKHLIEL